MWRAAPTMTPCRTMPPAPIAELNLAAATISLTLGGALLGAVGWLDRRQRRIEEARIEEAGAATSVDAATPADVPPTSAAPKAAPAPVAEPVALPEAEPIGDAPAAPLVTVRVATKPAPKVDVIDLTDPHGARPTLAEPVAAEPPATEPPATAPATEPAAAVDAGPEPVAEEPVAEEADDEPDPEPRSKLPRGAEAALLSILEAVPDPRNTIATKDPTAEVHVTRSTASRAKVRPVPVPPTPAKGGRWQAPADATRYDAEALRPGPPVEWGSRSVPILDPADVAVPAGGGATTATADAPRVDGPAAR